MLSEVTRAIEEQIVALVLGGVTGAYGVVTVSAGSLAVAATIVIPAGLTAQ